MNLEFVRIEINHTVWEVPGRYQDLNPLAAGAYGQVCSATDTHQNMKVAIKKLTRPFQSDQDAKRTYRELRLLKHMNHENVIGLLDVFTPSTSCDNFQNVYLVTHLMGDDLHKIINNQRLSGEHVRLLVYEILRGLKYIHSAGVIHRDLKPGNIAVNANCELKILDFGLARHTELEMTGYVTTRWYRAPEVMLNWMHYNQSADIWSVGCIMAELLTSKPLFPGMNHTHQLNLILQILGTPSEEFLAKISSDNARNYIRALPLMRKKNLRELFEGASQDAVSLLESMLEMDADKRPTAMEALAHPYLARYADTSDEPVADSYDESFEDRNFSLAEWKRLVYDEIVNFVPQPSGQIQ